MHTNPIIIPLEICKSVNECHLLPLTKWDLNVIDRFERREIYIENQGVERVGMIQSFRELGFKFHAEVLDTNLWFDHLIEKINELEDD
jgi:hypothetical protein